MASLPKSRWADEEDTAEAVAHRKKAKEERRKAKEEKLRKAEPDQTSTTDISAQVNGHDESEERSAKRRRTSAEPENSTHAPVEGANMLQFPSRTFGPSRSVEIYELLNNIEEGSYGMVSRARARDSGEVVALKRLKMEHSNDGFPVTGLREIQTLRACRHRNIVHLKEIVVGDGLKDVYLVMEFLEHDLKTLLEDMAEPFLPSETKTLMAQIVSATEYLHSHWILHRDLKTSNLLLNNRGEIKVADFGMARYTGDPAPKLTQLVVTLWYRAPELLLGAEEYGSAIDVWSVGCIFAELLTRDPLFQGTTEVDQLDKIFRLLGTPTKETWPAFRSLPNAKALHPILNKTGPDPSRLSTARFPYLTAAGLRLLASTLALDPDARPTASAVLAHPYFREDPRPKPQAMFPTFPSKAGQEKRRRRDTPHAPGRGDEAAVMRPEDFKGLFAERETEEKGAGFALRMG